MFLTALALFACSEHGLQGEAAPPVMRSAPDDVVPLDHDPSQIPGLDDGGEVPEDPTDYEDPDLPEYDPDVDGSGRMTGGGSVWLDEVRVTHGFTLRCEPTAHDNLQVNFEGHRFHATSVEWIACADDPDLEDGGRRGGLDTLTGVLWGRYDGVDGASIEIVFTDDGEPGTTDEATMVIVDAFGHIVLDVTGPLEFGNHQAHGDGEPL